MPLLIATQGILQTTTFALHLKDIYLCIIAHRSRHYLCLLSIIKVFIFELGPTSLFCFKQKDKLVPYQ